MRDAGARPQAVPVISAPAQLVAHRTEVKSGVRYPAANYDIGAFFQGLDDSVAPDVHICMCDTVPNFSQRLAGIDIGKRATMLKQVVDTIHDVVAGDGCDLQP